MLPSPPQLTFPWSLRTDLAFLFQRPTANPSDSRTQPTPPKRRASHGAKEDASNVLPWMVYGLNDQAADEKTGHKSEPQADLSPISANQEIKDAGALLASLVAPRNALVGRRHPADEGCDTTEEVEGANHARLRLGSGTPPLCHDACSCSSSGNRPCARVSTHVRSPVWCSANPLRLRSDSWLNERPRCRIIKW
ncbi:hypothetical protein BDW62DRAFT_109996 [Aspergillus aurantiobrunneus]